MLSKQALKDFEAAVGAAHVSDDPTIVRSYAWNTGVSGGNPSERLAVVKPVAIVMPSTTEEVQAVVKACLRNTLAFRPQSTGHLSFGNVMQEGAIAIDLRRMDRIVEIDADNQLAVIEPYVTVGDLITASMKVGLTSHSVGAGWTHSPLASATSMFGIGITGQSTSQNARNLLAWEWVTPQGEIVRGGAAGAGVGWFAGEGPGPGFRGVIRGSVGAMGGLGIFTKIGYKLHPWDGTPVMEHVGAHPNIGLKLPERDTVYQCVWDDWDQAITAVYELMNSKSANFILRIVGDHYGWTLAESNREYYDQRRTNTLPEIAREVNGISWTLMTVSATDAEAAWRDRTIRDILARTSGRLLALDPHHAAMIARGFVTACYVPRALRSGACGTLTTFGVSDSMALIPKIVQRGGDLLAPYKKPGGRMTEGDRDQLWIWPQEGRTVWAENLAPITSRDDKATGDAVAYAMETFEANEREPLGVSNFVMGSEMSDLFGPKQGKFNDWMRKIKGAFDPNWASDGDYIKRERFPMAGVYPIARHVLFRSHRLLSMLMLNSLKSKVPRKKGEVAQAAASPLPVPEQ